MVKFETICKLSKNDLRRGTGSKKSKIVKVHVSSSKEVKKNSSLISENKTPIYADPLDISSNSDESEDSDESDESQTSEINNQYIEIQKQYLQVQYECKNLKKQNEKILNQNRKILKLLQELGSSLIVKKELSETNASEFIAPSLPIDNLDHFIQFDCRLKELEYKQEMVDLFRDSYGITNNNVRKYVKLYIEQIVTYDILIIFSWSGKSSFESNEYNKLKFVSLTGIINFIHALFPTQELDVVDSEIKYFMKRVPQKYKRLSLK